MPLFVECLHTHQRLDLSLPNAMAMLEQAPADDVRCLNLSGNRLTARPPCVLRFRHLLSLSLIDNDLASFSTHRMNCWPELQSLDLSGNARLPREMRELKHGPRSTRTCTSWSARPHPTRW